MKAEQPPPTPESVDVRIATVEKPEMTLWSSRVVWNTKGLLWLALMSKEGYIVTILPKEGKEPMGPADSGHPPRDTYHFPEGL
jgi:hypothetical protein